MKKRMSRILSALLVSVLVISTGNVVQAEDAGVTGKPEVEDGVVAQQAAEAQEIGIMSVPDAAKELTAQATVSGRIPLSKITKGNETAADVGAITYYNTSAYKKAGNQYGYSELVSLTKGTLILTVTNISESTHSAYFGLYRDANLTQPVDNYAIASRGMTYQRVFKVPSKGSYYIGVYSNVSSSNAEGTAGVGVAVVAQFINGENRTLKSGVQVAVGVKDAQTTYFKFKATKTGYITAPYLDSNAGSYNVTLLNSKKKALSGARELRYEPTFGVQKGKTYYIKVKSNANWSGGYVFKLTNTAVKESSGKKKASAKTIKRGATKKGTILAGSGQADWYKFKKTSKKDATITFKGRTNDKIKIEFYQGGKKIATKTYSYSDKERSFTMVNYPKGTYYIKVVRGTKKSSGWYSVKWK